jgi:hypothetical protein
MAPFAARVYSAALAAGLRTTRATLVVFSEFEFQRSGESLPEGGLKFLSSGFRLFHCRQTRASASALPIDGETFNDEVEAAALVAG